MRKLKNFSLIMICMLALVCSALVFTGCNNKRKNASLFVFATEGGCVQVNNETDCVEFGDEGEIYKFKQKTKVSLRAIADEGYDFVKWEYVDNLDQGQEDFSTQAEINLVMNRDKIVIRAVFVSNGQTAYSITYTNDAEKYTIVPETGYSNTVLQGGEFKFKINLTNAYKDRDVVVRSNDSVLTADGNGVYTISNINTSVEIVVEIQEKVITTHQVDIPTGKWYVIQKTDNSNFAESSVEVLDGENFKFKLLITDPSKVAAFGVKANGNSIYAIDGVYTILVTQDVVIDVIIEEVKEIIYQFNLRFDETVSDLLGSDIYNFPQSISFTMLNTDEMLDEYESMDFMVSTSFGDTVSARELFADMYHELLGLDLGFSTVKCLAVGDKPFMTVDEYDILHIDWSLISSANVNELIIVVE